MVTNKIYFMHQFDFPCNFYQIMCSIPIQNHIHCWWIEIKESPKYKLHDNIGDLEKTTFWYHSNDTKGTLGLCCAHIAQLMTYPAISTLPFTLQLCYKPLGILQRVTKSWSVHRSRHDRLPNFITSILLKIGSRGSQSSSNPSFPH